MKKLLLTIFLTCVSLLSYAGIIASGKCGDNVTWSLSDDGALTISGNGAMEDYSYNYSPWVTYDNAHTGKDDPSMIRKVIVEEGVTRIGEDAFMECLELKSVTLPTTLTGIGRKAFYYCEELTSLIIPDGVESIDDYAFFRCYDLCSINIPEGTTSIGQMAFCHCESLKSVTIPNSVTSIGERAFAYCTGLTSVTIGDSVSSIGEDAFEYCTGLPVIDNIRYADTYAIEAMDKTLSSYILKEGTKFIGSSAFYGCTGLTSIDIPNSVTSIGYNAFWNCTGLPVIDNIRYADTYAIEAIDKTLSSYILKEGTKFIGSNAFKGCTGLTSITIPESVISIGGSAFNDCKGLTSVTIPYSVTNIGSSVFSGCTDLTSIDIPNSVTSIGYNAFWNCTGLTSITIPNSVTSIDGYAFDGCSGLTSIYVSWKSRPLSIDQKTFSSVVKNNCTLYVPTGTKSLYESATVWMDFENIVEYNPEEQEVFLTTELNGIQASKQKLSSDNPLEIYVPESYSKVTFNGTDVTSQINDGKYVTPSITKSSTISIYLGGGNDDVNGDGNVDSQDVLHIYEYMKNH